MLILSCYCYILGTMELSGPRQHSEKTAKNDQLLFFASPRSSFPILCHVQNKKVDLGPVDGLINYDQLVLYSTAYQRHAAKNLFCSRSQGVMQIMQHLDQIIEFRLQFYRIQITNILITQDKNTIIKKSFVYYWSRHFSMSIILYQTMQYLEHNYNVFFTEQSLQPNAFWVCTFRRH